MRNLVEKTEVIFCEDLLTIFVDDSSFQVDMVEIKEVYFKTYQRSLADDIHTHCTEEDLRDILLSLIKGNISLLVYYFCLEKKSHIPRFVSPKSYEG